jgi:septal ring factor EnvC (AmiA/AmiB activator)
MSPRTPASTTPGAPPTRPPRTARGAVRPLTAALGSVVVGLVAAVVVALVAPSLEARAQPGAAHFVDEGAADPLSRMATLEEEIGSLTAELEQEDLQAQRLAVELDGLGARRVAVKDRLHRRVRVLYRLRRAGTLPLGEGVQGLLSHVARVERFERIVAGDVRALRALRARGDAIRTEQGRVADSVGVLRERLRALELEREGLSDQILAGRFFSEGFGVFEDGSRLSARYGSPGPLGAAGASGLGALDDGGGLSLPVRTLRGVDDLRYEGGPAVGLRAGGGAPVRAVAAGRVGYVGRYAELGRIVIVDHGGDLYGIYGGLGGADVQVSDRVPQGGVLGRLDGEGRLFLQLRRGTRALEARVLLGL